MGFYTPATIVKDAHRHGVKIKPVCVAQSDCRCTVVSDDTVRLGFCVVNGLRQEHAEELVRQRQDRQFHSLDDFKQRVPLSKEELRILAELGALNCFADHRRAAMWQVEETTHDDLLAKTACHPEVALATEGSHPRNLDHAVNGEDSITLCEVPRSARDDKHARSISPSGKNCPLIAMTMPERVRRIMKR